MRFDPMTEGICFKKPAVVGASARCIQPRRRPFQFTMVSLITGGTGIILTLGHLFSFHFSLLKLFFFSLISAASLDFTISGSVSNELYFTIQKFIIFVLFFGVSLCLFIIFMAQFRQSIQSHLPGPMSLFILCLKSPLWFLYVCQTPN